MLSKEFLIEFVQPQNWLTLSHNCIVGLSDHYFDRLHDRGIDQYSGKKYSELPHEVAMQSIRKIAKASTMRKIIDQVDNDFSYTGNQFYIVDHSLNLALGMRRKMPEKGKMKNEVGTIITPYEDGSCPNVKKERERCPVIDIT